jgi:hypothetical protein
VTAVLALAAFAMLFALWLVLLRRGSQQAPPPSPERVRRVARMAQVGVAAGVAILILGAVTENGSLVATGASFAALQGLCAVLVSRLQRR